jgi:putative acetyltransferase
MKLAVGEITVRPVRSEDVDAIWEISLQSGVIETTLSLPSDRIEQRAAIIGQLSSDDHYFVAEVEGQVVGLAGLSVGKGRLRHSGSIFVFVDRTRQGQGIGTKLLQTLLDLADNWLLLRRVELTVLVENEGAKRLYERMGFVVEGRRKWSLIKQGGLKDEWSMARYR